MKYTKLAFFSNCDGAIGLGVLEFSMNYHLYEAFFPYDLKFESFVSTEKCILVKEYFCCYYG